MKKHYHNTLNGFIQTDGNNHISNSTSYLRPVPKPRKGRFVERYKIHQYWSRKPWYVVRDYIQRFSNIGDTILDPFVGSGVTACEALILRRRIVAFDLNPIAVFITRVTCLSPVSTRELEKAFQQIEGNIGKEFLSLYGTKCPKCASQSTIINTLWNNSTPKSCFYICNHCHSKGTKPVDEQDLENIAKIANMNIPYQYPRNVNLPENSDVRKVDELFTKRNLIALSILLHEIERSSPQDIKDLLKIMFSSTIVRASKLIFVNQYRFGRGVNPAGVWGEKRFWIPNESIENNVFYYFKQRVKKTVRAKQETNQLIGDFFKEGDTFKIYTKSSTDIQAISDESIDYCFTDPPYGGSVQYLGLSTIWNSWLGLITEPSEEITINQNMTLGKYEESLKVAFNEIFRVLKPNKYLSVTFHNSKLDVWNAMLKACKNAGFVLVGVVPQEPVKKSHNQIELKGTVETDLVVTFRKPLVDEVAQSNNIDINVTKLAVETATEYLKIVGKASTSELYDNFLLKWISIAYGSLRIQKKVSLSLNSFIELLGDAGFEPLAENRMDYKGEKRQVQMWRLHQ